MLLHFYSFLSLSVLFVPCVVTIDCYSCNDRQEKVSLQSQYNLTANTLDLYLPPTCEVPLINVNNTYCSFTLEIKNAGSSWESASELIVRAFGTNENTELQMMNEIEGVKITMYALTGYWTAYAFISYTYVCTTDKCNSLEKMKSLLRTTKVNFDFNSVGMELNNHIEGPSPKTCLVHDYPSTNQDDSCPACEGTSSGSVCVRCQSIICNSNSYTCAGCLSRGDSFHMASINHTETYLSNSKKRTLLDQYICDQSDCNSAEAQSKLRSLVRVEFNEDISSSANWRKAMTDLSYRAFFGTVSCIFVYYFSFGQ